MNYLAHLHLAALASEDPLYLVGGMMGDFVKGRVPEDYPVGLVAGIKLHRRIDRYTDSHTSVAKAKELFDSPYRRYAGIVLDISFDHYLSLKWNDYSTEKLEVFELNAYGELQNYFELLPESLQRALPLMRKHRLLTSYQTLGGVARSLDRVSRRLTRGAPLRDAFRVFEASYPRIEQHFLNLYPDLMDFVSSEKL